MSAASVDHFHQGSVADFVVQGWLPMIQFGPLQLPTYFLIISLSCCFGIYWSYRRAAEFGASQDLCLNLSLIILVFGFLGARLFHVIIEAPLFYWQHPEAIFSFSSGGFVFYGGALTGYLGALLYIRRKQESLPLWHDLAAPVIGASYAIGRLGCFAAGCCYGAACPWPWAIEQRQVDLVTGMSSSLSRHPTSLYAFAGELLLVTGLLAFERWGRPRPWQIFSLWLIGHGLNRFVMEQFRADPRGPHWLLSVSAWLSLLFFLVGLILFLRTTRGKNHT